MRRLGSGSNEPLGLTLVPGGANLAVYSAHAAKIELCLFDAAGQTEIERIALPEKTGDVFHAFVSGIVAGDRYGLRAHGPYDPRNGHRFNPAKLLVDPYVKALDRRFELHPAMFGELPDGITRNDADSAPFVPKGIATPPIDVRAAHNRVPWADTIIYELHIRGFTQAHPEIPDVLRGTCAGLAHPAAIAHLTNLGVTTVELMPIAAIVDERHLAKLGLTNYWGYNPIAFFVPDPRLAPGGMTELCACVAALHAAGIEVVQDIVLNHTGEGDAFGPTLSLRGLDNATYYRIFAGDASRYVDDTGCGNTLALDRPPVLRLAMDVLRHYASAGIDGFRFDLATTLGRGAGGFDPAAPLLQAIAQDPVLRDLKLIAEPWDVGMGGYRLGAFPAQWGEWNDRYRDTVRRFWRGDSGHVGDFATRLAGSADIFATRSRPPSRSINFVAAHDGFTLADIVSYETKQNEANGEANRDGTDANFSWNHGIEGITPDARINGARQRDMRNLLVTLFASRGTPMLGMGDEWGRTQRGNNNAYAQDGPCTWMDWEHGDTALCEFVGCLIALRKEHPALCADHWLTGAPIDDSAIADIEWHQADGRAMCPEAWNDLDRRGIVAVFYAARADATPDRVAVAFNAGRDSTIVLWPESRAGFAWRCVVDTADVIACRNATDASVCEDDTSTLAARSVLVAIETPSNGTRPARSRARSATPDALARMAAAAGIAPDWWDVSGNHRVVTPETTHALLDAMDLDVRTEAQARERLAELAEVRPPSATVADEAARCFLPPELREGRRVYGLAAHLYALRRRGDQGIGDFTTLQEVAVATARAGGVTVGINPLHALFPQERERASPYHPSDRRFLDPIYIDVEKVPDVTASATLRTLYGAQANVIASLSARPIVDYTAVWKLKETVLAASFAAFEKRTNADALVREFDAFVAARATPLRDFAVFEAVAAAYPGIPWQRWPTPLRNPNGSDVEAFAAAHEQEVRFGFYQQWLAHRQLAEAAAFAQSNGLALGFYRDLAVGAAPDGAEAWTNTARGLLARGASIGAPPDSFSTSGQVWHLPPPIPHALTSSGYTAFRELVAANMQHAGALRIDHVMGLSRLFWVPDGATASEGAYVHYPFDDLLRVLAVESMRARCIVVGEDLGTVPEGLRERLSAAEILSYRVLWFEREGIAFKAPSSYPPKAATCVSTHDLPTVAGWWAGIDIDEKHALGLMQESEAMQARAYRSSEKEALVSALDAAGVTHDAPIEPAASDVSRVTTAVHRFACGSPSTLLLIQADDLSGETQALNLPGTDRERPNWRRKLGVQSSDLWQTPVGVQAVADLAARRRS